ncbi:hypothetical protein D3C79_614820 [compost metagenome]
MLFARQIPGQQQALPARSLDPTGGFLRIVVLIKVGEGNVCAFAGVGDGDCTPDPAVGASDQRYLAVESAVAGVGVLATVRGGFHLALRTRDALRL